MTTELAHAARGDPVAERFGEVGDVDRLVVDLHLHGAVAERDLEGARPKLPPCLAGHQRLAVDQRPAAVVDETHPDGSARAQPHRDPVGLRAGRLLAGAL